MPLSSESVSKKGHSRKRSHSERSLLDLEKLSKDPDTANTSAGVLQFGAMEMSSATHMPASAESQMLMTTSPSQDDVEFYNELAAMFVDQDVNNTTSPAATPETIPAIGSSSRIPESQESGKKPLSSQIQHVLYSLIRPFPALINSNRICSSSFEGFEEPIKDLGKNMMKVGL